MDRIFVLTLILLFLKGILCLDEYAYPLYITSVKEGSGKHRDFFSVALKTTNVSYTMTPMIDSRSGGFFSLESETGSVSTIEDIDREFMSVHYFKVSAIFPSFTSTTTLQINVEDVNDNAPIFEHKIRNATVKESLQIGSSILTVRANDADAGDNGRVTYFLESDVFRIGTNDGILSTRKALDRESQKVHSILVTASDNSSPPSTRLSSEIQVFIRVQDENDNHPQFEKSIYYLDIEEDWNWSGHPIIGNVTAFDKDEAENAKIKYTIIGGNNDDIFEVSSETGEIFLRKGLDRETLESYRLILRAQDLGNPPKSNTTQLLVRVLDINDNPPKFPSSNYYQSVAENVPEGYSILQMSAFDPDLNMNSKIVYSIKANSDNPFTINEETGWISTTSSLDREASHSYVITVLASDRGLPPLSSETKVHVTILDRNDNDPRFVQKKYEVSVSEDAELGKEILVLSAIDRDDDSQLRYEIVGGNTRNRFGISTRLGTGIISVAQPLDFRLEKYFYLNVNAVDSGGRFGSALVSVNISDANNYAPTFENTPYMADVFEDTPIGATVMMLFATDQDYGENARLSYQLEEFSEFFEVEPDSGALIVRGLLDRETIPTFILSVLVKDHGSPNSLLDRTEIEISVLDINDNPPMFSADEYFGSILENAPIGSSILRVMATDPDEGDNAECQYRFGTGDSDAFTLDRYSGVIRTSKELDRESEDLYVLTIESYDGGLQELISTTKVTIEVLDINDNPPKFPNDTLYFNLKENSPIGTIVGEVKAVDPDLNDNALVVYKLLDSLDKSYFTMKKHSRNNSVSILSAKEFDFEGDKRTYFLSIRAESSPLRSDIGVTITITDLNDNPPTLSDFSIIFNHPNEFFSGLIGKVPAKDNDPTAVLSYGFTYGNLANLIRLNSSTGDIHLSPSFYSNVPISARIGVKVSDGKNEVRSNLHLQVNYVSNVMLENSVTLRLANVTKNEFLSPYYSYLMEALSVILPCSPKQISVFSIVSDAGSVLNVTFAVSSPGIHEEKYIEPEIIKSKIFLHYTLLQKILILNPLPFDENLCVQEPCLNYEQCLTITRFGTRYEYLSSDDLMFRSIEPVSAYKCSCPSGYTGMKTSRTCDVRLNLCYSNPCNNGGFCIPKENGYICKCPNGYEGSNCQFDISKSKCEDLDVCAPPSVCSDGNPFICKNCSRSLYHDDYCRLTSRSFSKGSFVAFHSIEARYFFNITLEFASQSPSGLIFYNGRLSGVNDFLSLYYTSQKLHLAYSLGSKHETLDLSTQTLSDGNFHRVQIFLDGERTLSMSVDDCDFKLALNYGNALRGSTEWRCANFTTLNSDFCNPYLGNCRRSFDLSGPLLVGGLPSEIDVDRIPVRQLQGCVKSVYIDGSLLNMNSFIQNSGSVSGCPEKRKFCDSSPCRNGGSCKEGWRSYRCVCQSGWDGKNCNYRYKNLVGLRRGSSVSFKKDLSPISLPWYNSLSFKTTSDSGTLLLVKVGEDKFSKLFLKNGTLTYSYANTIVDLTSVKVNDGLWHHAQVKWMNSEVWLNLDYGQREITQSSSDYLNQKIVSMISTDDFEGCIRNVRAGISDGDELEISLKKKVFPCLNDDSTPSSSKTCPRDDKEKCLDFCSLKLCSEESRCLNLSPTSYRCVCGSTGIGRYCESPKKQICPAHWWGTPICGPCNCDPAKGFKETCNQNNGNCSCKSFHYRPETSDGCKPCSCHPLGSTSSSCHPTSGKCQCKPGILGLKCDRCAHQFSELDRSGCKVVYGNCPAEFKNGISWKRSPIGTNATAPCPAKDSKGTATRLCTEIGWSKPQLKNCIHNQFLKLKFSQNDFNDEPWKGIYMAYKVVNSSDSQRLLAEGSLYNMDSNVTLQLLKKVLKREIRQENFNYAHMKERNFLTNLINVLSWLLHTTIPTETLELISLLEDYGQVLTESMEETFTNPLEVSSPNVIFGLDSVQRLPTIIPKYNNYMRRPNSWSKVSADISASRVIRSVDDLRVQYSEFNLTGLPVDRSLVAISGLRWGTKIKHFSNAFSFRSSKKLTKTIIAQGNLKYPHDRLYCVYLDQNIWTSLDCEHSMAYSFGDSSRLSINCSCSGSIFSVIEEIIEEQKEYLEYPFLTVLFLSSCIFSCSLLATISIILCSFNIANSVSIHMNISIILLAQQILIILSVTFNATLIDMDVICKLIAMSLHYLSITSFIWSLIDSIHIYRMLKELRDINQGKMSFYSLAGFGLPAVIVSLTVGVSGSHYGAASFCWLSFSNLTSWAMILPEVICALVQTGFLFGSLNAVFNIRSDIEDFSKLRKVFFVNAGLLPVLAAIHSSAFILMNSRTPIFLFIYSGACLLGAFYLLMGFIFCDHLVSIPLRSCCCFSSKKEKDRVRRVMSPIGLTSKSSLNYKTSRPSHGDYLDGESTTSRSSDMEFKDSITMDEEKHYSGMLNSNLSESDSEDIERRSLDLASSHSSDEDDPRLPYKKTLFVNDYPSTQRI